MYNNIIIYYALIYHLYNDHAAGFFVWSETTGFLIAANNQTLSDLQWVQYKPIYSYNSKSHIRDLPESTLQYIECLSLDPIFR